MRITKPIIWFDLETTGTDTENDRICQIAAIKIAPTGERETKNILINPEVSIPLEASEVHGITNEIVKDAPTFKQLSLSMRNWFNGCDLGGFNSNRFDVPLLSSEFERAGLDGITWNPNLVDGYALYLKLFPNTLSEVYKRLFGEEFENAHDALADIEATLKVVNHITEGIEDFETPAKIDLHLQGDKRRFDLSGKMYVDSEGKIRWNFSKNKDLEVISDRGFAEWFLKQGFPQESKNKVKEILYGKKQ